MARRKSGRDIHGWLILDKPLDVGSTEAVGKARWALQARKAGHAGTLDPLATGLLAIAFGEATKTIPFVTEAEKGYRFTVRWGEATTTDDREGEVSARSDARPSDAQIEAALPAFRGDVMQTPPAFSAVKVAGERAYDLARDGETVELAARPLHVSRLELVERPDADHAVFEMDCGKGGYVRAVARDLGAALGCLGHVAGLRRVWSGPFDLAQATVAWGEFDGLREDEGAAARLLPLEAGLADLPQVRVTEAGAAALRNGQAGVASHAPEGLNWGDPAWASHGERAVALGVWGPGVLRPSRVFQHTAPARL
ncbi:MAG: tRNA pseudouridine(55) synthase TruB [Pseudomonadota bacterium]